MAAKKASKPTPKKQVAVATVTASAPLPIKRNKNSITIPGKGSVAFHVDGALNRLECGKPVTVTPEQRAVLDKNGIKYS